MSILQELQKERDVLHRILGWDKLVGWDSHIELGRVLHAEAKLFDEFVEECTNLICFLYTNTDSR